MIPFTRSGSGGALRARTAPAVLAAAAVVAAMLPATAAHAAAADEFVSSFEAADRQPLLVGADGATNVTGGQYAPGSILPLVSKVTASAENLPNEGAAKLADGNASSKWLAFAASGWAQYQLSQAQPLEAYTLTSGGDAPDRDPKNFTVQGSNDGTTWDVLDTRSDESAFAGRGQTRTYTLPEATAPYLYYRLNITAVQKGGLLQVAGFEPISDADAQAAASNLQVSLDAGPTSSSTAKTGVGFTGTSAVKYAGRQLGAGAAASTTVLYEDVDIAVSDDTELSYVVFPALDGDQSYASTFVAVDLTFDDGTTLSESAATDEYGYGVSAENQGAAKKFWPDQWNRVAIDLSDFAGRTVTDISFDYAHPAGDIAGINAPKAGTTIQGWLDDVRIGEAPERDTTDGLVSYVDTTRGTNSSGGFSRGNNFPATAVPNGFNFITPMTNANTTGSIYEYQARNTSQNRPALEAIGFSHQPSIWMGDRNQLAILPQGNLNPTSSLAARRLAFGHENEIARPDIYDVTFDNGIRTAVTPTDHGAVYRFDFVGDGGSVIVDQGVGASKLTVNGDTVSGWVDGGSGWPGRTRMYVYGQFDRAPKASGATTSGDRNGSARFAGFDTTSDKNVELRIASSFISQDQAKANFGLELDGVSFDEAHAAARAAWNDRLSAVHDVEGASDAELETLYSSLYRLNLYPNSQYENVGTADNPEYAYASPVAPTTGAATDTRTNAKIVEGKVMVNNGFWDTYRTAWPLYSLLYPDVTEDLVDGFVQQYRDSGWIARWSSPGYADLMTGTSSDVAFAEAYLAGALDNETALEAYDAAVKNATVKPATNAVGRKGLERSIFLGYTEKSTHQSVSWGLEGFINDFGIAQMAAKLAEDPETPAARVDELREEATYFASRAEHYAEMFNPEAGVFTARNADGTWPDGADFDKKDWNEDVTEASAWTFAFHAPFDVDGMAALYGGRQGLIDELHDFLTEREEAAYSGIHEAREARDTRHGMLGFSNQVSHHIPYVLAEAGDPSGAQELIRDLQERMFVGGDIGQGYPGDEDNGEFSSWYVFSALGFYPLEVGSGDYTIGTPLFESATLTIGGRDITIKADGASKGKDYVAGVDIDGTKITDTTFDGDLLRDGSTMTFTMSDKPSSWGAKNLDEDLDAPAKLVDATKPGRGTLTGDDPTDLTALSDDSMNSSVSFADGSAAVTWKSASGPVVVSQYTLTGVASGTAPTEWMLEGSVDGKTWTKLDERADQAFRWGTQTRPFSVKDAGAYTQLRLTASNDTTLQLAELELFVTSAGASELSVTPQEGRRVAVGATFDKPIATIIGAGDGSDLDVTVSYGDDEETGDVVLTRDDLGGLQVSAAHTFTAPGTYDAVVTVRGAEGAVASTRARVEVFRDESFLGAFTNNCIGSIADKIAANCDGLGAGYDRDQLAESGFEQGKTLALGDTGLTYDLPKIPTGKPDNATGEGQTFAFDLGEGAKRIAFIGTANETDRNPIATLTFTDGTTQEVRIGFGDWVGAFDSPKFGGTRVGSVPVRMSGTGVGNQHAAIYATAPVALDLDDEGQPKTLATITMPKEAGGLSNGRVHVFAIASDGERPVRAPLEVTAGSVEQQIAGEAFDAELATVSGGAASQSALVNWGDGSELDSIEVADGKVSGSHTYAEAGSYTVAVTVDDGIVSASTTVTVEVVAPEPEYTPSLSVDDATVAPGDSVKIGGSGFAPGESISIRFGTGEPVTVDADDEGAFSTTVDVPASAVDGEYAITAIGAVSQVQAGASVQVRAPEAPAEETAVALTTSATDTVAGDTITLVASVTPAEAAGTVTITNGDEVVATGAAGGRTEFEVQLDTAGSYEFVASFTPEDAADYTASVSEPLVIEVGDTPILDASLSTNVKGVVQGGSVVVTGRGFQPGERVAVTLHSAPLDVATLTADGFGAFKATVTIPLAAEVGQHELVAVGASSELSASAALEVTAATALPDGLPTTGGVLSVWLWTAAALLLAIGALLVVVRRRRQV